MKPKTQCCYIGICFRVSGGLNLCRGGTGRIYHPGRGDVSPGLPAFNVSVLPDMAVQEARERVRAALSNRADCEFPLRRITINLAPVDLKKPAPLTICQWP